MRLDAALGTIQPGKAADLIVLDRNPMDQIDNIETVRLVMKEGTLYRSADLWRAAGFTPRK
jgi:imidazolonepropionase-like amidohydrolase